MGEYDGPVAIVTGGSSGIGRGVVTELGRQVEVWGDGTRGGARECLAEWGRTHALGRVSEASEIGAVVLFLTGPRAGFVTGAKVRSRGASWQDSPRPFPGHLVATSRTSVTKEGHDQ